MSDRPEPWENPDPARFTFEAVPADPERWITPSAGAGRCRHMEGKRACEGPPVASILRTHWCKSGKRTVAWDYCADHLYGRWVEDGKVMGWRLVERRGCGETCA